MKMNGHCGPFTPKPEQASYYRKRQPRQEAARRARVAQRARPCRSNASARDEDPGTPIE